MIGETPKWQVVLYTPDAEGEMVARGNAVGWVDYAAFDVTPETLPVVLERYWGPTVGQFAGMLRQAGVLSPAAAQETAVPL